MNLQRTVDTAGRLALTVLASTLIVTEATAQDLLRDSIASDVRVGIVYQSGFRPGIAVPPMSAAPGLELSADSARAILRRDFDFSDRLDVMGVGEQLPLEGPINYELWDRLGAVWLLIGSLEGTPEAPLLRLSLHDVVFKQVKEVRAYELTRERDRRFRFVVHGASDDVVALATGTAGMASTRVAFVDDVGEGSEIWLVDSDGFGRQRITSDGSIALSPTWSPDGKKIAYMSYAGGDPAIFEFDLEEGRSRLLTDRPGLDMTPAYSPNGGYLAYSAAIEDGTEIYTYDLVSDCCPQRITFARFANSLSPSFSPDGKKIAFNSDRLGQLHIFVGTIGSGNADLVTPYIYDRSIHNAAPDWSPTGDRIAFHARVEDVPQILTVAPDGSGLRQLTQDGRNEDPSWAPDGRHIAFASTRVAGTGIWVLDVVSGRIRMLVRGAGVRLPDWSGRLDSPILQTDSGVVSSSGENP